MVNRKKPEDDDQAEPEPESGRPEPPSFRGWGYARRVLLVVELVARSHQHGTPVADAAGVLVVIGDLAVEVWRHRR